METVELKATECTFENIKKLIGSSLNLFVWPVDNGGQVKAQVKTTTRNGLVATAYLHATIIQPSGQWAYWRELKGGTFRMIDSQNALKKANP